DAKTCVPPAPPNKEVHLKFQKVPSALAFRLNNFWTQETSDGPTEHGLTVLGRHESTYGKLSLLNADEEECSILVRVEMTENPLRKIGAPIDLNSTVVEFELDPRWKAAYRAK